MSNDARDIEWMCGCGQMNVDYDERCTGCESERYPEECLFVAVDIGCIECGEDSAVLGIFTKREEAEAATTDHEARHGENWHGQHHFEVYEVPGIDRPQRVEYK